MKKIMALLLIMAFALSLLGGCGSKQDPPGDNKAGSGQITAKEEVDLGSELPKVGPYSHAIRGGGLIFLTAQGPFDIATGQVIDGDITAQTAKIFANVEAALAELELSMDDVLRCTVYLRDMDDFTAMNEEYARHFQEPYPARTCVGVSDLPIDALLTIEFILLDPAQ